jgi:hypothetical protein
VSPITPVARRVELGQQLVLEVAPDDTQTSAILSEFRQRRGLELGVAFGGTPVFGTLYEAKQTHVGGVEQWLLVINPSTEHIQGVFSEPAFDKRSADDIADLRARRLLLNERIPGDSGRMADEWNSGMLEVLVRGLNTHIEVKGSPFPGLFKAIGSDPEYFLVVARLFGILFLYLSATVDRIHRLDLRLERPGVLSVRFEGQRPRRYVNVEPPILKVEGRCDLHVSGAEA